MKTDPVGDDAHDQPGSASSAAISAHRQNSSIAARTSSVTDRSMAIDPFLKTTSIHTQTTVADSAGWEGNIAWNDNHVTYETTGLINAGKTKVGDAAGSVDEVDDLFLDTPVKGLPQDTNVKMTYR